MPLVSQIRRARATERPAAGRAAPGLGKRPPASSRRFRAIFDRGEAVTTGSPLLVADTTGGEALGVRQWVGTPGGSRALFRGRASPVAPRMFTTFAAWRCQS